MPPVASGSVHRSGEPIPRRADSRVQALGPQPGGQRPARGFAAPVLRGGVDRVGAREHRLERVHELGRDDRRLDHEVDRALPVRRGDVDVGRADARDDPTERNDTKILKVVVAHDDFAGLVVGQRVIAYMQAK